MRAIATTITASPYAWPHDGSLEPSTTALVVVDMQRDFCEEGGYLTLQGYDIAATRAIIPSVQTLIQLFRHLKYPIYHTREGHRPDLSDLGSRELFRSRNNSSGIGIGDHGRLGRVLIRGEPGHDTIHELYPRVNEPVVEKPGKSAFTNTDFDHILRVKGIRNLVFCGVTTDVCVSSTMREANDRGYDCLLIEDCSAASNSALHNAAIKSIQMEGGIFGATTTLASVLNVLNSTS